MYGKEAADRKRAQLREIGKQPRSEQTRLRLSQAKKRSFAEGRSVAPFKGKNLSDLTKQKIGETRRKRYGTRRSLNKKVRFTSKYRDWRTSVFERDSYTCQRCGANSKKLRRRIVLHAHHQVPLDDLLRGLTFVQAMEDPAVWSIDNAETLCVSCHRKEPIGGFFG